MRWNAGSRAWASCGSAWCRGKRRKTGTSKTQERSCPPDSFGSVPKPFRNPPDPIRTIPGGLGELRNGLEGLRNGLGGLRNGLGGLPNGLGELRSRCGEGTVKGSEFVTFRAFRGFPKSAGATWRGLAGPDSGLPRRGGSVTGWLRVAKTRSRHADHTCSALRFRQNRPRRFR